MSVVVFNINNIVRLGSFTIHATNVRLMMAAHGVSGATTDLVDVDLVEMFNLNASEIIVDGHACIPIWFVV